MFLENHVNGSILRAILNPCCGKRVFERTRKKVKTDATENGIAMEAKRDGSCYGTILFHCFITPIPKPQPTPSQPSNPIGTELCKEDRRSFCRPPCPDSVYCISGVLYPRTEIGA